jgi:hypothetical protein
MISIHDHYELKHVDSKRHGMLFEPGEAVVLWWAKDHSYGTIVSTSSEYVTVLWSKFPNVDVGSFSRFQNPWIKTSASFQTMISQVKAAPMTVPKGDIFYVDYVYGADSQETERTKEIRPERPKTFLKQVWSLIKKTLGVQDA